MQATGYARSLGHYEHEQDILRQDIIKLSRIGLTAAKHARFTTGLEPIILGVGQPSLG